MNQAKRIGIYTYIKRLADFREKFKIWSRFFSAFYLFSPISQRMFNDLDKLTNGIIDNQEVKLPKN